MDKFKNYEEKLSPSYFHLNLMKKTEKQLSFSKKSNFESWRKKLRVKFKQLIGPIYKDKGKVDFKIIKEENHSDYKLQKIIFPTNPYVINVAYLLIPNKKKEKYPAFVCLQGHSSGAHISVGVPYSKEDKEEINGDRDFAIQAVKNGFVALAIEQRCFGEREEKLLKQKMENRCWDATMHSLMLGHTLISERISDVIRGIDLLYQFPFVDKRIIGCMGNSGGGTITYYASCIEDRIKISVPSCSFCTYEDSIMKIGHCMDNYIPSSFKYFGMEDLAGLIAPKFLIIVAGKEDNIFPIAGVRKAFNKAKEIYEKAGHPERIKLVVGTSGHRFYASLAWKEIMKVKEEIIRKQMGE